MPSLWDRIRAFLNPPIDTPSVAHQPDARALPNAFDMERWRTRWGRLFLMDWPRRKKCDDYDLMDSGPVGFLLDAICDACFISDDGKLRTFKVECKNPKYQQVVDQVLYDTGLALHAWSYLRETLKYGDTFVGLMLDMEQNIVGLENPHPKQMVVQVDTHNRLLTGMENGVRFPYWQVDTMERPVASWEYWEMRHMKFMPTRRSPYSTRSFYETIRADWYKLKLIEEFLVVTRLTRTAPRAVHKIDVTGKVAEDAVKERDDYIRRFRLSPTVPDDNNSRSQEDRSFGADEDYFVTTGHMQVGDQVVENLSGVELLDPDIQGIRNLPDVEHLLSKIYARVPGEMVGQKRDNNDVNQQDIAGARFLQYCQIHIAENQLIRPILNLALLLKFGGIAQDVNEQMRILWPSVIVKSSWRTADAQFRKSMADANRIEQGTDNRKHVAQVEHGWTDAEWEEHVKQVEAEKKTFGEVPRGTNTGQQRVGNNSEAMFDSYNQAVKNGNGNGHHVES